MPPQPHHLRSHPSERDGEGAQPPPTKPGKQQPPNPPHPPRPTRRTRTKHPRHPSSRHYHHPNRTRHPDHPPSRHQHRPKPEAYPGLEKGAKVQQPFRNDHTGDWIWCEGTIQYRLRDLGEIGGPQIRVIWQRQKKLDQGSSAPDKPEGHTVELNSAHPIRLRTDENKAHRGTKYTGELPPEWSQGLPPPRPPKRPPPRKKSPSPCPPP